MWQWKILDGNLDNSNVIKINNHDLKFAAAEGLVGKDDTSKP